MQHNKARDITTTKINFKKNVYAYKKEANIKIWEERVECKAGINYTYKCDGPWEGRNKKDWLL